MENLHELASNIFRRLSRSQFLQPRSFHLPEHHRREVESEVENEMEAVNLNVDMGE